MQFTFRTRPPSTYLSPSGEEMREVANKVGLKSFSKDLVADLCNLAAGGSITPPSLYRRKVMDRVEENLPVSDSDGGWQVPESVRDTINNGGSYTKNRQVAIRAHTEVAMRYHMNVCDFLQTLELDRFPGGRPLEKAMSLLKMLSKKSGGGSGNGGGEPLPIFTDSDRPEGIAEEMHDTLDMVDSLSEDELNMLDPDGNQHEIESEEGQKSGHQSLNRLKVAEDLVDGSDKRVMLDISRKLDQFTKMQVRRQRLVEVDPAGEEIRQRPIHHLGELSKVSKSAWAMRQNNSTYFLYKAVTGQLPVKERVTRMEKKQAIFILVDGSGSMSGQKHWKATGVVMNRLKAVLSGDAEVWVSVFDTQLSKADRARTPEEARKLVKKFAKGNYSGGGTDIAVAVRAAYKEIEKAIKKGEALYRPEIVVLTDEDSSISGLKKSEVPKTRVHGFAMSVANPSLVKFAKSTGGVGMDNF